jgi:hypothetical protein
VDSDGKTMVQDSAPSSIYAFLVAVMVRPNEYHHSTSLDSVEYLGMGTPSARELKNSIKSDDSEESVRSASSRINVPCHGLIARNRVGTFVVFNAYIGL